MMSMDFFFLPALAIRFIYVFFFPRYHVLPLLRDILRNTAHRYYLWVACCAEFFKENDYSTRCERWSSFHNQNWYSPAFDTPSESEAFLLDLLDNFSGMDLLGVIIC